MTLSEFKRHATVELKSFYNVLIALHYLKKARKHLHKDIELSKAYRSVAEIYDQRSKKDLKGT